MEKSDLVVQLIGEEIGGGNLIRQKVPLHRLELCSSAPEADALSTELQGRAKGFYHI